MNNEQTIKKLEIDINKAKGLVSEMDALARLTNNKDFKQVIRVGYFEKEASRLVLLRADPEMASIAHQSAILRSIDAIGELRQYLSTINQVGVTAERALTDDENTLEEVLAEDLANG